MQKIAIIQISEAGASIASLLQQELQADLLARASVDAAWNHYQAFVFIGAMGICVRTIAPFVKDKHHDPAVVCVDSMGQYAIPVLSGHVGGANDLARRLAELLGAEAVVTTQSDGAGLWALDTLDRQFGWTQQCDTSLNECIFAFVNRQPTALLLDVCDKGTDYLRRTMPSHVTLVSSLDQVDASSFRLLIAVTPYRIAAPVGMLMLQFVPRVVTIGFGLAHQAQPVEDIYRRIVESVSSRMMMASIRHWCTIDVKAEEPFVAYLRQRGDQVRFFTADELAKIEVPHPSDTVARHVGTPSVSEAAAILGAGNGRLVIPKEKGANWTFALALDQQSEPGGLQGPHIEIVGAGPGDPDLVSVRGRRMLEQADLILYAGSLVPRELTTCHKPGAVVRSSASMALEEQCRLMKEHYDQGHFIVRLHTGDPCIFGAIQEQMAFFDQNHMSYHITPGISSFLAAAAELRSQFTIPERTQTIILTRGEGRTPMPEKEQLHLLARSQSTMCIFLSAAIVDDVQRQLLQEYPEETPVAACYHLTWPDQKIYRGVLKDLARIVHDNHLTLTTMLVVGEAIDNRHGLSELYNRHFTHLFRKGEE
ncbi:MAG: precorrin-4 C(11)-methyltransferase [Prevotella sp.]|nr:precorrin-4 C(11)-methyltransferase [Prevotella sp.]